MFEPAAGFEQRILPVPDALAEQRGRPAAFRPKEAEAHPVVDAPPGLDAVETREAVGAEQIGVVELEVAAVLIGNIV